MHGCLCGRNRRVAVGGSPEVKLRCLCRAAGGASGDATDWMGLTMKPLLRIPALLLIGALIVLAFPDDSANGKVFLNHQRVTVTLVGGISAEPCPDPHGCARGIVELRRRSFHALHHVRCLSPQSLHVVSARQHEAVVFACRRLYHWRMP